MSIATRCGFRRAAPPLTVLGLHVGADAVSLALLVGDGWRPRACQAWAALPLSLPASAALGDASVRAELARALAAHAGPVTALALVLETEAFVCERVRVFDDGTAQERAQDLRLELLTRHPALGASPRWVLDADGLVWALSQAQWQDAQALAQQWGAALALIGHADAARALALAHSVDGAGLANAPPPPDPAGLPGTPADPWAALGAALGVWHGLQPQWWPEGAHRRRRRVLDTAGHALRAGALGAAWALLGGAAVHGTHAWHQAQAPAQSSVAELEDALVPLQRAWALAQQRVLRAQQHQQHIAALAQQHRHIAQVLQAGARVPGLWLASVSQQGRDWQWQGEAETPAHAQQLLRALTQAGPWRQAPQLRDGRWQIARDAAATVWAFRIQAQSESP